MDFCFKICFVGLGRLALEFLGDKFYLSYFLTFCLNLFLTFFSIFFLTFKKKIFINIVIFLGGVVLWWNFINICSTFAHSFTQFFSFTVGKCKSWMVCFFLFLGSNS